jgi:cytochrome c biogenesis protein
MKSFLRFFSSVKLAIFLLIFITTASILGTLIPQHRSPTEYVDRYGDIANFLIRLEITKLYQSWWFVSLLFLFAVNILICTLTRLSPKLKKAIRPKFETEKKKLLSLKTTVSFKKNQNLEEIKTDAQHILSSKHFRLKTDQNKNTAFLLARKRVLGFFGSDIVHLGLLIILIGGIISGMGGFRTSLNISEGEIVPIPQADFKLRLDKFVTEYHPNGSVRDWKSTLTVLENGSDVLSKTIEVNHPLSHKGFVFYQSSYGWDWKNPTLEIWAKKKNDSAFLKKFELGVGEKAQLGEENIEITVLNFVPDFIIGENNEIATRSLDPNNPAAYIEGWQEGKKVFSNWVFAKFPDFGRMHSDIETDLSFEFKDLKAAQYSGIQMSKDPGVNFIWAGSTLLMIGLCVAFFWPTREIKIILEESQNKTDVTAGGIAAKNREDFQSEFDNIMASLRKTQ